MKNAQIFSVFVIIILFLSMSVFAAGSSTSSPSGTNADADNSDSTERNQATSAGVKPRIVANRVRAAVTDIREAAAKDLASCDEFEDRQDRIKCKLIRVKSGHHEEDENYNDNSRRYESCQRLAESKGVEVSSKEECRELYSKLRPCYDLQGRDKLFCFKRHNGLLNRNFQDADKKDVRHYAVALLYELQERIEHAIEDGDIQDEEKASEVIELIVQIKESIMNGETRDVIRPMLQDLRTKLNELRASNQNQE